MADIRNRVIELRTVRYSDLVPNPANWRGHPEQQRKAYEGIVESIGFAGAALARVLDDGRLMLIDGHMRRETHPDAELPVLVTDLTEDEANTVLATYDPISAMAQADAVALDSLLRTVNSDNASVQAMLAQLAEDTGLYKDALPNAGEDQGAQIDRAEELRELWQTERGQLWVIPSKTARGEHRLLCGDSTNADDVGRVMARERAVLMHTDPPYGVDVVGGTRDPRDVANYRSGNAIENDDLDDESLYELLRGAFVNASNVMCEGAAYYVWHPPSRVELFARAVREYLAPHRQIVVWVKDNFVFGRQDYHWQHEPCFYGWIEGAAHHAVEDRTQGTAWVVESVGSDLDKKLHPTAKPVGLPKKAIQNSSNANELIYEPFCGAGATLVACEQLARLCRAIELEPKYVAVILQRMKDMGLEPRLA